MKKSKYNFFFNLDEDSVLAFNALRNGMAVIPKTVYQKLSHSGIDELGDFDEATIRELLKGGFICDDNLNEFNLIRVRKNRSQYASHSLGLTIAPTLSCNLACKYCFETPSKFIMDEKIIQQLTVFVENYINRGIQSLGVVWYGGEPLLAVDVIDTLSKAFISLCEKKNVKYTASIITNGVLLTKETAELLKTCNISMAQITLDGDRDSHNARRPYRGGNGSFNDILANVKAIAGFIPVIIRSNIDVTNSDAALNFLRDIKDEPWFKENYGKSVQFYFGHVRKYTSSCACSKDEVLKQGEFWIKDMELKNILSQSGFSSDEYPNITSGCCATNLHSYVVDPRGDLYKCWNHIGEKTKAVGSIFHPVELNPLHIEYLTDGFEYDEECVECKCLPVCMGGCIDIRIMAKKGEIDHKDCSQWKFYLEESLRKYYSSAVKSKIDAAQRAGNLDKK